MKKHNIFKKKMDRLVSIMLIDGVQPSDLAENIFEKPYKKITMIKNNDFICLDIVFEENIEKFAEDNKIVETTLRYTYNNDKQLTKIERIDGKTKNAVWDRDKTINNLIKDIIAILKNNKNKHRISNFINSLPKYWQQKFSYQNAA